MNLFEILKNIFRPKETDIFRDWRPDMDDYKPWYIDKDGNKTFEKPADWVSPWGDDYNYLSYYYANEDE